jgi:hypothetical protein
MTKPKPPVKVKVTLTLTLDHEAREAWCLNYGVENTSVAITEDVKRYIGNSVNPDQFKDIIGARIETSWR